MARKRRFTQPGEVQHLIWRFVGKEFFIAGDEERSRYLELVGPGIENSDWDLFSFAVMSNHIHFGALAGHDSIGSWIQDAHSDFATWINKRHKRIGAVFVQHGPTAWEVDKKDPARVARLIAYLHRNPVRAGVVKQPRESDWTSHQSYVGDTDCPPWLDVELGLELARSDPTTIDELASSWGADRRLHLNKLRGRPPKPR